MLAIFAAILRYSGFPLRVTSAALFQVFFIVSTISREYKAAHYTKVIISIVIAFADIRWFHPGGIIIVLNECLKGLRMREDICQDLSCWLLLLVNLCRP